jgi:hypothetical protein
MNQLKDLAGLGVIEGDLSYFNELIDAYGSLGRTLVHRTFSDRERERVDLFLKVFARPPSASVDTMQ